METAVKVDGGAGRCLRPYSWLLYSLEEVNSNS